MKDKVQTGLLDVLKGSKAILQSANCCTQGVLEYILQMGRALKSKSIQFHI